MSPLALATIIFAVTYFIIITERIDRTTAAIAGALVMVFAGVLDQHEAVEAIDFNTLGLLVGMMIIVAILGQTGVFSYVGFTLVRYTGGRVLPLLVALALFTAGASAFLDNVTTILLMVPVTISICDSLRLPARPFLITQVIASNIGGAATLIGDPPNILIGSETGLSFTAFLLHLGPVIVIILAIMVGVFALLYRDVTSPSIARPAEEMALAARRAITDPVLLRHCLAVLTVTLLGFFVHGALHLEVATIALGGATALLLLSRHAVHDVLAQIEWPTIFFFGGLFVLVGGIEKMGLLDRLARGVLDVTGGDVMLTVLAILWLAAILSAIIDNIPAVTTLIPMTSSVSRLVFPEFGNLSTAELATQPEVMPLWWALALGACLGGNGTLIGASANVVAAGMAERANERISFWNFTKLGLPVTVMSLVVSSIYLWLRYL